MSEQTKTSINGAILIVLSVVLTASVAFLAWTAQAVYNLNAEMATIRRQQDVNTESIKDINQRGSPVIQAVMVRLDNLQAGQARIENKIDEHMKTHNNQKP